MATRRTASKTTTKSKPPVKKGTARRTIKKDKPVNATDLSAAELKKIAKPGKAKPAAKKSTKPAATPRLEDQAFLDKVKALKDDDGLTYKEIGRKLKITTPQIVLLYKMATVKPKDRAPFKGLEGDALAAAVVVARDEQNMSWQDLQVRTRKGQASLKRMYEQASGQSANQGFDVMRRMMAAKVAERGGAVKSKTKTGEKVKSPAKRTTARNARKRATGSTNPSKG